MITKIKEKISEYLNGGAEHLSDKADEDKVTFVNGIGFLGVLALSVFSVLNTIGGDVILGVVEMGWVLLLVISIMLIRRKGGLKIAANIIILVLTMIALNAIYFGGFKDTSLYWIYIFPASVFFLVGLTSGLYWLGLLFTIFVVTIYLVSQKWISIPYDLASFSVFTGSLFLVSAILYLYQASKMKVMKTIVGQAEKIEEINKQLIDENKSKVGIQDQLKNLLEESKQKNLLLERNKVAMINVLEDVKEEKDKVMDMANDLEKFELAVENASDQIVITDPKGIVLYANKATERITGYKVKDVIGEQIEKVKLWGSGTGKEFYSRLWKTISEKKETFTSEISNTRKNGEEYESFISISPIFNANKDVIFFVGLERDITKEKEIDRMKTEFISLASHQLRTPLSAMKWFSEILSKEEAGKLNSEQKELVTNIYESNERMIALVNALLNISRIESGRIIIDPKPTDLRKLVQGVVDELKVKWKEKDQTIVFSGHRELPKVSIDSKLIRNVYLNLISNAIKYTPEGGEISILISQDSKNIVSQVSDNGCGIPKEEHDKVFQKFFRATNVAKIETDGSGLGLYLVKAVIKSSGGDIWFKSKVGQGTTFWFSLPLGGSKSKKGQVTIDS